MTHTPAAKPIETAAGPLAAVILAAGQGTRLQPLTSVRPKALCPVGNRTLLERAIERMHGLGVAEPEYLAINACSLADQIKLAAGHHIHLSIEPEPPLGTAGALGKLRDWIDGRPVLVGNADAYLASQTAVPGPDIAAMLDGWDGRTVRLLGVPAADGRTAEFGKHLFAGFSLLPWSDVAALTAQPSSLVLTTWRPAERAGRLEVVEYDGIYLDTGTPADYLAANVHATAGENLIDRHACVTGPIEQSVIGAGAHVDGSLTRCVVWPGGYVDSTENLVDAIRIGRNITVEVEPA